MKPYYEEAGITIYHGENQLILPQLPKCDLLLTDPPYGIGADSQMAAQAGQKYGKAAASKSTYLATNWDASPPPDWFFGMMREWSKYQIIFGGNYFPLPPSRCWLVWDKDNGTNHFADCELAWTNLDKAVRLLKWMWNGMLQEDMSRKEVRVHPTQKPLPVMKWALSHAPNSVQTVLDPYMGSGTTLVAAKAAGLTAVGIEREEEYCEAAVNRLRQSVLSFEDFVV